MSKSGAQKSGARLSARYLLRLALIGIVVTTLLMSVVMWWEVNDAAYRFERESLATHDLVSRRLSESEAVLSGLAALHHALDEVGRDQLSLYASEMLGRYPHIGYIEYQERVLRQEVAEFEKSLQAEGYPSYRVWERQAGQHQPVAERPFYYPIVFIEPLEPERAQMLGYDVYSDTDLHRAIDKAISSGDVSASAPFKLMNGQQVYTLFKVVYSGLEFPNNDVQKFIRARRLVSLLVKAEYLLASSDFLTPDANITLSYPVEVLREEISHKEISRELFRIESTRQVNRALRWVLPELKFSRMLDGDGQPFLLVIKKQLGAEIFRLDILAGISLFSLLLIMLLYMRRRFVLEREHSRDILFQHREQAEITLHSIADAVITTDAQGRVEHMNATAEQIAGWSLAQARGKELSQVLPLRDEHTEGVVLNPVAECIREGRTARLSEAVILRGRQGGESLIMANASPIRDRDGQIIGAVLVFHDVSKERQMEQQLAYQASHDALTGLLDRGEFERRLNAALHSAKTSGRQHALCYMDLDQFKVVNDACGHAAGDELLVQLSALLMATVRDTDILARLGGDEFAVLLMDCPLELAANKAESLRDVVKAFRFIWQGKRFDVGFGIGVVPVTENSGTTTDVLRAADIACYAAKSKGRNQVFVYESGNPELEKRRGEMRWATRIGEALEKKQFWLYYQAIKPISAEEPGLFHCELLMRREDEKGELASPEAFIPAAERFNLMPDIDRWVVSTALPKITELARQAAQNGGRVLCGINLSGQSLGDETFYDYVSGLMDTHGVPAEAVCFEITETSAISNLDVALTFIQKMRARGCRFALDDFGTGVSSFSYLKKLPLDYVKIDGSFIRELLHEPVDEVMVESINRIAHTLGIKTIAEYVENDALLKRLRELGTDYAQGYAIARPAPLDERLRGTAAD